MNRCVSIMLGLLFFIQSHAQQFQVESFNKVSDNASAVQNVMKDANDTPCAILRIISEESGLSIVGSYVFKPVLTNGTEYIVNVADGAKNITISKKGFIPLIIQCSDHNINRFYSNQLYEIKLKTINYSNEVSGEINGHEYVDLGLSVKWATVNIGAKNRQNIGNYYKYGATEPYNFNVEEDYSNTWWHLDRANFKDVAKKEWGNNWRMPTEKEWTELTRKCSIVWTVKDGIKGALLIAKNGNKLFLPSNANDFYDGLTYWSSDGAYLIDKSKTVQELFGGTAINTSTCFVRAVCEIKQEAEIWQQEYSMKPDGYNNGHAYVDLGLSVKWATTNIFAKKYTDIGEQIYWGSTLPFRNSAFNEESYENTMHSYCRTTTPLKMENDAARYNWKSNWRTPTKTEIMELLEKCTWKWTYNYNDKGKKGYMVTSNIPGYTDKSIFIPVDDVAIYGSSAQTQQTEHGWYCSFCDKFHGCDISCLCLDLSHYHQFLYFRTEPMYIRPVF